MITLLANAKGQLYTCSQLQDYVFRGKAMEHCCLLAFVIDTWEETYKPEAQTACEEEGTMKRGRPAHPRAHYLEDHPKSSTHRRVFRAKGHNTLPQIAGLWFPQSDEGNTHDFYCACMLALLKPWCHKQDLKTDSKTWAAAFSHFRENATWEQKRIIAGIQYYYKSKTACETSRSDQNIERVGEEPRKVRREDMEDGDGGSLVEDTCIPLTEQDLVEFQRDQVSPREETNANLAIEIAKACGLFSSAPNTIAPSVVSYRFATGNDETRLFEWLTRMRAVTENVVTPDHFQPRPSNSAHQHITELGQTLFDSDTAHTCLIADLAAEASTLPAATPNKLLEDQRRAYDIIDWHLGQHISGRHPKQMRMIIPGEAGVGKSKTIQTITANFVARGVETMLVKAAYTGLAASGIGGKTLHCIAMLPLQGSKQSAQTIKALEAYWADKQYLIIDEISMVSREMFAKLSSIVSRAKAHDGTISDEPFGGVNVILVGDFHQFPPVAAKPSAPLYWPCNPEKDTDKDMLGRKLYEQFEEVVRLKTQVRVTDEPWLDLLQHVR